MIEFNEMEGKSSLYETLRSVQSQEKSVFRITIIQHLSLIEWRGKFYILWFFAELQKFLLHAIVDRTAKLNFIQVSFGSHNLKLITILEFYNPLLLRDFSDID